MKTTRNILWVDCCANSDNETIEQCSPQTWSIHRAHKNSDILNNIHSFAPNLIIFNFDCPNHNEIHKLSEIKKTYPAIPIILLTGFHSEELALWALRIRIYDIQHKPINIEDLINIIDNLFTGPNNNTHSKPANPINTYYNELIKYTKDITTNDEAIKAFNYVKNNYSEKFSIEEIASHCNMSPRKFSHVFKRECGITLKEYLLRFRIDMAIQMLNNSSYSITTIATQVGFNDHSYFTRVFRKYVGINPSLYNDSPEKNNNVSL